MNILLKIAETIKDDFSFLLFMMKLLVVPDDSKHSPYVEKQEVQNLLDKSKDERFHQRYLFRKNEYRASLLADHEPQEVEESVRLADNFLRSKAKLDLWNFDDPELDDIVSVGKRMQDIRSKSQVNKNFDTLDDPSKMMSAMVRIIVYVLASAALLYLVLRMFMR